jgi:hypothetical protein
MGLSAMLAWPLTAVLADHTAAPKPLATNSPRAQVVIVHDPEATEAFKPDPDRVRQMVQRGITELTGKTNAAAAWSSLAGTNEVIGIKVHSAPGPDSGTRPVVVAAIVEGLLSAHIPSNHIVIWDRQRADLRRSGFLELSERYGVRVQGSANEGFDEGTAYSPERPILGQLVYGDVEFGRKGDGVGRRSFVTKLLTKDITRIISVTPLLNHNTVGVNGHLYSLAIGSVDNVFRFENDLFRLSSAVPEIYALPSLSDRVILNVTDALICQYQGEQVSLLHYAVPLNELRFSKDPVALDFLSLRELERARKEAGATATNSPAFSHQLELLHNASLLELGVSDPEAIHIERK